MSSRWSTLICTPFVLLSVGLIGITPSHATNIANQDKFETVKCDTSNVTKITTQRGSREIRRAIDSAQLEMHCAYGELKFAWSKYLKDYQKAKENADTEAVREKARRAKGLKDCLTRNNLTKTQLESRLMRGPTVCGTEWAATFLPGSRSVFVQRPERAHARWLSAVADLGQLAQTYPDSFKPSVLPTYLRAGRAAEKCLQEKKWCYQSP